MNIGLKPTPLSFKGVDAGGAEDPREGASVPLPWMLLAEHEREFKSKPFRERDNNLLSIEVWKKLLYK